MAFTTKTIQTLGNEIIAGLSSSFGQTIPIFEKAFSRVLAKALAGPYALLWRYAGWIFLQMFVRYATDDEVTIGTKKLRPLTEWGRWIGVGERDAATRAQLVVAVTVTNQTGTLRAGEKLLMASTGVTYAVAFPVALNAATVQATIRAVSDQDGGVGAGTIGNLAAGDVVSFLSPVPNIARDATVVSVAVAGADEQTVESYRTEIIEAFQSRPQGGALIDYRIWAKTVTGIVGAYPYKQSTPGTMRVYIEATAESSGSADGIPIQAQLDSVEAAIVLDDDGLASRLPAGVEELEIMGITRPGYDVEITSLTPDTTEARESIEDALSEHLSSREPFILGVTGLPRKDKISDSELTGIAASVAATYGATFAQLILSYHVGGTVLNGATLGHGERAKLSAISFTS